MKKISQWAVGSLIFLNVYIFLCSLPLFDGLTEGALVRGGVLTEDWTTYCDSLVATSPLAETTDTLRRVFLFVELFFSQNLYYLSARN